MDAFYAAVEIRDNPELEGKAVVIGSKSERGVVATCSYEARKYGIHSAMSSQRAIQLCPDLIFIQGNMKKYVEESLKIKEIVKEYTDIYEFLALDEGYLDVTNTYKIFGNELNIANAIKNRIKEELNLTCSVGIAYNKMTAKLASEENKPNGIFIIEDEEDFLKLFLKRSVKILPGIGNKAVEMMKKMGIEKVSDLMEYDLKSLGDIFGKKGTELYYLIRGIDTRTVGNVSKTKSYGSEVTFEKDVDDIEYIKEVLVEIIKKLSFKLQTKKQWCKTVNLKIKYADFQSITRSKTVEAINEADEIYEVIKELLLKINFNKKLRLAGLSLSNITDRKIKQMKLGEEKSYDKKEKLAKTVFNIKEKYGIDIINKYMK